MMATPFASLLLRASSRCSTPAALSLRPPSAAFSRSFSTSPIVDEAARSSSFPSGWRPPKGPLPGLPFSFSRVNGINLPVYTDWKNANTIVRTILRKYDGDVNALVERLEHDLGVKATPKAGHIVISGNHSKAIKKWLLDLGF